ncbi:BTAD domain-containing putative transcriptional regulator [Methylocapsa sp. S129]|uniref:BTAD domain-containing putative transcriptional regulator n=1 Tax=Methylocapsa sp. S129 TaxID=1641869 RepID=UPI00131AEEF6|nr:BTAD domain-containing putative transcriptional regulator [Methylocapsa sp. S129]
MHARNEDDPLLSHTAPFELRVLGPFELVHRQSGELIPAPAAKMQALIVYLAAAPRFTDTRRRLAGLLWASSGDNQARQSLRQLLSNFRRSADPRASAIVTFDETNVSLASSLVAVDRAALMEAPADADVSELMRTADLYRNDFAQGLEIGEPDFDAWLSAERMRSREAAIALFDRLIRALISLGRHDEALRRANRLAEIDPLREETHRLAISQEAIVSGRASAMQRYEAFRVLLRDELSVRPEPATLRLLEELRQQQATHVGPVAATAQATAAEGAETAAPATIPARASARSWRRPGLAVGFALVLLFGGLITTRAWRPFAAWLGYVDTEAERASVVVLPFEIGPGLDDLRARAGAYEAETRLAFADNRHLSLVERPDGLTSRDPIGLGRALHVRYVVATSMTKTADGARFDVSLSDAATGGQIFTAPAPMTDDKTKFVHQLYQFVYPEIAIHQAEALAAHKPNSNPALLWRAQAVEARTGINLANLAAFETVLANRPSPWEQNEALLGLADALFLRAGVDRSKDVDRTEDIRRGSATLEQAKALSADPAEVAFLEGMRDKLQSKYPEAGAHFARAVELSPRNRTAAAQAAHVKMFGGLFDEAYRDMELIKDVDDVTAFIAGETALMADHPDSAVVHFDAAVSHNPEIARNHAWRAVALWRKGRKGEAQDEARKSQNPPVPYQSVWMQHRAPLADKRYQDQRDACYEDFLHAYNYAPTN